MNKVGVQTGQSRKNLALIFSLLVLTTVSSHKGNPGAFTSNDDVHDESDGIARSTEVQQPADNKFGADPNNFISEARLIPVFKGNSYH